MEFETEIGEGLEVLVKFDYKAGYAAVLYGDNPEPGSPAEVEITSITHNDICIYDVINETTLNTLEIECFEHVQQCLIDAAEQKAEYLYETRKERVA